MNISWPRRPEWRFIAKAIVAAFIGSTVGAAGAVWSVRGSASSAASAPGPPGFLVVPPSSTPVERHPPVGTSEEDTSKPVSNAARSVAAVSTTGAAKKADREGVLQQARALAQRPDVNALIALREGISQRAEQQGDKESADTRQLLEQLDRYLLEARRLRLKLDGDALRSAAQRPHD